MRFTESIEGGKGISSHSTRELGGEEGESLTLHLGVVPVRIKRIDDLE